MYEKIDITRVGNSIDLDPFRIDEVLQNGTCTFVSSKFYNKGVYRVMNNVDKRMQDFAVNIDKIEAATYKGLVEEFGKGCVDASLWDDVPDGSVVFFYSFKLETELVEPHSKKEAEFIEA
ncbi:MAG: hypothetical protein P1P80_00355 [ANME-2 cluster archaeon]|nr:hypothetical protein [ANME-2 cluster archaeon]